MVSIFSLPAASQLSCTDATSCAHQPSPCYDSRVHKGASGICTDTSINTDICAKSFDIMAKKVLDDKDFNPKSRDYAAVLYEIRDSDLPPEEKSLRRMSAESQLLISAGMETTGNALSFVTYHLLKNPDILRKLREELDTVGQDLTEILEYKQLRELPYLVS